MLIRYRRNEAKKIILKIIESSLYHRKTMCTLIITFLDVQVIFGIGFLRFFTNNSSEVRRAN